MIVWLIASGLTTLLGAVLALFLAQLWALRNSDRFGERTINPDRYRALLTLLRDLETESKDSPTTHSARHQVIGVYLRSLTADYGAMLAQVRRILAQSNTDRPDLARLLVRSRFHFAVAMCRIRLRLALHRAGIVGIERLTEDIVGVVNSVKLLHQRAGALGESAVWGV